MYLYAQGSQYSQRSKVKSVFQFSWWTLAKLRSPLTHLLKGAVGQNETDATTFHKKTIQSYCLFTMHLCDLHFIILAINDIILLEPLSLQSTAHFNVALPRGIYCACASPQAGCSKPSEGKQTSVRQTSDLGKIPPLSPQIYRQHPCCFSFNITSSENGFTQCFCHLFYLKR